MHTLDVVVLNTEGAHIYFKASNNPFRALIADGVILLQLNTVCGQTCSLRHVCEV